MNDNIRQLEQRHFEQQAQIEARRRKCEEEIAAVLQKHRMAMSLITTQQWFPDGTKNEQLQIVYVPAEGVELIKGMGG
jgi:hypothetical protein